MKKDLHVTGIVCEYNPFHNGHEYQLKEAKNLNGGAVVAVMSGNFTQRGEASMFEKHARAKAALKCGADLVVELPLSFAVSSAERFAYGAVYILNAMGCVDTINFGSESGEIEKLYTLADILNSDEIYELTSDIMRSGVTFAAARQRAAEKLCDKELSPLLSSPNNTLGIEYIRAAKRLDSNIGFSTVKRHGAMHDDDTPVGKISSASFIRERILSCDIDSIEKYVPKEAFKIYKNEIEHYGAPYRIEYAEAAVLDRLRRMTREDWADVPDVSEGLHNRIYDTIRKSCSLDEILSQIKTKRYTLARIRRIILLGYLGVTARNLHQSPGYVRVLGMNNTGIDILRMMKKTCSLPFGTSLADLEKESVSAQSFAAQESLSTDLYMLMCKSPQRCGADYTIPVVRENTP